MNSSIQLLIVSDDEYQRLTDNLHKRIELQRQLNQFKKDCRDNKIVLDLKTKLTKLTEFKQLIEETYI